MFGSGIILTLISHTLGWNVPMNEIPMISWLNIGFLVIVSSVTAFIAYIYILQVLPTSLVSIYAYINPIVAVTVGGLFFDEKLSLLIFIGILITLAGVYVVNLSLRKRRFFFRPPRNRI
jgi:drug/metabolite transporter (DMT)-like permease